MFFEKHKRGNHQYSVEQDAFTAHDARYYYRYQFRYHHHDDRRFHTEHPDRDNDSLGGNTVSGYVEARYPEDDADWDTWIYPDMTQSDYVSQEMIDELVAQYPDEIQGIAARELSWRRADQG